MRLGVLIFVLQSGHLMHEYELAGMPLRWYRVGPSTFRTLEQIRWSGADLAD